MIIHSTKIRPDPHSFLTITAQRINGIIGQCIGIVLIGNCKMGKLACRRMVNIQPVFGSHPQLVIRFELQRTGIGIEQATGLSRGKVYLNQPAG